MTYQRQIATVKRLIAEKGGLCTYVSKTTGSSLDSSKPWRETNNGDLEVPNIRAVFIPAKKGRTEQDRVQSGVNEVYIAAASLPDVSPKPGDAIIRANETTQWRVTTVDTLNVNGELIVHIIQAVAS